MLTFDSDRFVILPNHSESPWPMQQTNNRKKHIAHANSGCRSTTQFSAVSTWVTYCQVMPPIASEPKSSTYYHNSSYCLSSTPAPPARLFHSCRVGSRDISPTWHNYEVQVGILTWLEMSTWSCDHAEHIAGWIPPVASWNMFTPAELGVGT